MARTDVKVRNIAQGLDTLSDNLVQLSYLTAVNGTPGAGQFRSTITGRASMVDLSSDLMPRMGYETILTQQAILVPSERGSNGEPVYKPVNDRFDQVRFVGIWGPGDNGVVNSDGQYIQSASTSAYAEVTFYGTGLNILVYSDSANRNMAVSVDGGGEVTIANSSLSGVLQGRRYSSNSTFNLCAGLALGLHTVKIRQVSGTVTVFGFQILNEASTIKVAPGTALASGTLQKLSSLSSLSYNSDFESGTLGTRGGRAVIYLKKDGSVAKALTPTNTSQANMSSADHTNEEIIRTYYVREFGSSRSDDYTTLVSGGTRGWVADDGVTAFIGTGSFREGTVSNQQGQFNVDILNGDVTFTFVGTGLDVMRCDELASGSTTNLEISVDGTVISSTSHTAVNGPEIFKIVSGLPYGTHTVNFKRLSGGGGINFGFRSLIVYGPKKPAIPTGAIELGDYNIMANFVANTTTGLRTIATGVLRKHNLREHVYSGSWSITLDPTTYIGGHSVETTTNGNYKEFTFFGTGFELRGRSHTAQSGTNTLSLQNLTDGGSLLTLNSTNFPGLTVGTGYGGYSYTYATGNLAINASSNSGAGFSISGLPLKLYKLRVTNGTGSIFWNECMDVITPIHIHKNNGPSILQNVMSLGNHGINDCRKFGDKQLSSDIAISSRWFPVAQGSTTSTSEVPIGMQVPIYLEKDSLVSCQWEMSVGGATGQNTVFTMRVDGGTVERFLWQPPGSVGQTPTILERVVPMSKGYHLVSMGWSTASGTVQMPVLASGGSEYGNLTVRVLK